MSRPFARRRTPFAAVLSLVATAATAQPASESPPPADQRVPPIRLQAATFVPEPEAPVFGVDAPQRVHVLVSFPEPLTPGLLGQFKRSDITVLDRCPDNAYFVGVPLQTYRDAAFARLIPPAWLSRIRPEYKLSPVLRATELPKVASSTARRRDEVELIVLFFGDVAQEAQRDVLAGEGATILQRWGSINGWRIAVEPARITSLAEQDAVKWIEEGPPPAVDFNDEVRGPSGVNAAAVQLGSTPNPYGLSGAGVTIAQWESKSASTGHADFAGRIRLGDAVLPGDSRSYRYVDGNANKDYDGGEALYLDVDDSFGVSAGDWRTAAAGGLPVGAVLPADGDVGTPLRSLRCCSAPWENFFDELRNGERNAHFDPGEAVYMEQNNSGLGRVSFGRHCTRAEMQTAGGAPCADIRMTAVARAGASPPYPAGSKVASGDEDVGRLLTRYAPPHDHATHVAGTMIGSGQQSVIVHPTADPEQWKGIAPGASLIGYYVKRLPDGSDVAVDELRDEFAAAIEGGASIASNSWGFPKFAYELGAGETGYDVHASLNDALVSGVNSDGMPGLAKRLLIVSAAGNASKLDTYPLPTRLWRTVQIPNSAKNVLTVANVTKGDKLLSGDSLRGPTGPPSNPNADGRLKPDIAAPGRGDIGLYQGVYSAFPPTAYVPGGSYFNEGGTSMATPAVSGSAALLSEWHRKACDASGPTPDLLRALLVHTADDVEQFLFNEVIYGSKFAGPDYGSGYGTARVDAAVKTLMHHRRATLAASGDKLLYPLQVGHTTQLKVTLAWDDPPNACPCGFDPQRGLLRNDLDLLLIAPSGQRYGPWQLDAGNPDLPASLPAPVPANGNVAAVRDHRNTIEQVLVRNPTPGQWQIEVSASHVDPVIGAQPFAVVSEFLSPVAGDQGYCPGATPTDIWLRDNAADDGSTPSAQPLYRSPDVWNRVAADGGTAHQNPVAQATNYLYARLRNDRPQAIGAQAVSLDVWLAPAATGLNWPADFSYVGRIDTADLQANEVRLLGPLAWSAPSPQPSDHFCFYIRAMSPQDPITVAETGALGDIVASSNNLAWRNVNVVDVDMAAQPSITAIAFQIAAVGTAPREAGTPQVVLADIEFAIPAPLLEAARIAVSLQPDVDRRWRAAYSSAAATRQPAGARVITPGRTAGGAYPIEHPTVIIENLPLHPGEKIPVRLTIEPRAGATLSGSHEIEVRQHQRGTHVGGIVYQLRPK